VSGAVVEPNLLWTAAATVAALAIGTAVRLAGLRGLPDEDAAEHLGSLKTWWAVALVALAAALLGRTAAAVIFAVISTVALREFVKLLPADAADRRLSAVAYALVPLNYLWIGIGWPHVFVVFLPLAQVMLSSATLIAAGTTRGFVRRLGAITWGSLLTVYFLSHAVLLFSLPAERNPGTGGQGWFLYLVLLTEANDIVQALVGRRIGKRKITPRLSPHKTWEGFLGGGLTTLLLAVLLAGWLTPFGLAGAISAGLVILLFGFFGDLNMSAVKREAGVKDSSRLLPGQGGMLDRVDSLTFTAPAFYYFILLSENVASVLSRSAS